jgi:hypothetical protein
MRIGFFNPIAGTKRFSDESADMSNQVVLWSNFSEVTDEVKVPLLQYLFPIEVQNNPKSVKVQIARYELGYWHEEEFFIKPGDMIGKEVDYEPAKDEDEKVTAPETLDFSTESIMVDAVPVVDWSQDVANKLNRRQYYEMLYSSDGINLEKLSIGRIYWPKDMQLMYSKINEVVREDKEPLRSFQGGNKTKKGARGARGGRGMGEREGIEDIFDRLFGR